MIKLNSFFSASIQNSDGPSRYDFLTWDIQDMPTETNLFGLFVYNVFWQGPIEKIAVKLDLLLLVYLSIDCLEMDVIMLLMGLLSYTKNAGCACAGNAGDHFPRHRLQRKPLVSDPGIHHGTCLTHVPCCMSGSLTRGGGENVPGIPGACATRKFTYPARAPIGYAELSKGVFRCSLCLYILQYGLLPYYNLYIDSISPRYV